MTEPGFTDLLIVVAVAFAVPFVLGLFPKLIFLAALALARGLPAILYRPLIGDRRAIVAGLFQATSLPFIVAATAIGRDLGLIGGAESAELIAAGLVSVALFPLIGSVLLQDNQTQGEMEWKPTTAT